MPNTPPSEPPPKGPEAAEAPAPAPTPPLSPDQSQLGVNALSTNICSPPTSPVSRTSSLEEMNALNVAQEIARCSSPLGQFVDPSDSLAEAAATLETEAAAVVLQTWVKNVLRIAKVLNTMEKPEFIQAANSLFGGEPEALANRLRTVTSAEAAVSLASSHVMASAATAVLVALPRDATLRPLPVAAHGPRAFLAALLVAGHPESVLGANHAESLGQAVKVASRLLCASATVLTQILAEPKGALGRVRRFRAQLVALRFARRFHAAAFQAWRVADRERAAEGLVGPYSELAAAAARAQHEGDESAATTAHHQAEQLRVHLRSLLGAAEADRRLQEVDAAVEFRVRSAATIGAPGGGGGGSEQAPASSAAKAVTSDAKNGSTSTSSSRAAAPALSRGFLNSKPSAAPSVPTSASSSSSSSGHSSSAAPSRAATSTTPSAAPTPPTIEQLGASLMNEELAHSLIMNPAFQLPSLDEPKPFAPPTAADLDPRVSNPPASSSSSTSAPPSIPQEVQAAVQATMQKMFWAKLVSSLTPSTQRDASEFKVGSVVQARYGGPNGAFYAATVTAVHLPSSNCSSSAPPQPTFDICYAQDGVVETNCLLSQFRLASDPVDARPLLALVEEVRKRLEAATPHATTLHASYRAALESDWLLGMVARGTLELPACVRLAHFLLEAIVNLEAPARAARTEHFKQAFTAYVCAPDYGTPPGASSSPSAPGTVNASPFVRSLPQFFAFCHAALDQLKRDTVNYHLSQLAPSLAGAQGILYERAQFDKKVASGVTTLQKTELWLGSSVTSFVEGNGVGAPASGGPAGYTTRRAGLVALANAGGSNGSRQQQNEREGLGGAATSAASSAGQPPSPAPTVATPPVLRDLVAHALVELLAKPVKWDAPESGAAHLIPETLVFDAPRLAKARDAVDHAVLVSTSVLLLKQALASLRVGAPRDVVAALAQKLDYLLRDPSVRLPSLQHHIDAAAQACCAQARVAWPAEAKQSLQQMVESAADAKNAVFALFTKRAFGLVRSMLLAPANARQGSSSAVPAILRSGLAAQGRSTNGNAAPARLLPGGLETASSGNSSSYNTGAAVTIEDTPLPPSEARAVAAVLDAEFGSSGLDAHFTPSLLAVGRSMRRLTAHQAATFAPHYAAIASAAAEALPPPPAAPMA